LSSNTFILYPTKKAVSIFSSRTARSQGSHRPRHLPLGLQGGRSIFTNGKTVGSRRPFAVSLLSCLPSGFRQERPSAYKEAQTHRFATGFAGDFVEAYPAS